jgi:hypothetical protein
MDDLFHFHERARLKVRLEEASLSYGCEVTVMWRKLVFFVFAVSVCIFSNAANLYAIDMKAGFFKDSILVEEEYVWVEKNDKPVGILRSIELNPGTGHQKPSGDIYSGGAIIYSCGLKNFGNALIFQKLTGFSEYWRAWWLTDSDLNRMLPLLQEAQELINKANAANIQLKKNKGIGEVDGYWNKIYVAIGPYSGNTIIIAFSDKKTKTTEKIFFISSDPYDKLVNAINYANSKETTILKAFFDREQLKKQLQ